jgi:hypothetical protein
MEKLSMIIMSVYLSYNGVRRYIISRALLESIFSLLGLLLRSEDGANKFLRNKVKLLPD